MNRDDIIRMARAAGLIRAGDGWTEPHRWGMDELERFAALVAAAERDAIANEIQSEINDEIEDEAYCILVALLARVRARGQE